MEAPAPDAGACVYAARGDAACSAHAGGDRRDNRQSGVAASNAPVDLRQAMQRMTLEIAGRTMFSFGMDPHGAALRDFVMEYGERLARPHFLDPLLPLGWPRWFDFARARFRKRWTAFVGMLMAERRAAWKNQGVLARDLFDLMGDARHPQTGDAFADAQLADQIATMILAGHETTATALFWALYLLALDPRTRRNSPRRPGRNSHGDLDIEPAEIYPSGGGRGHAAQPPRSCRARRPRPGHDRGYRSGRRMSFSSRPGCFTATKSSGRSERLHPAGFMTGTLPDRFAYLPFGVGARVCIGAQFALTEATLALAKIVAAFRVELVGKQPVMPIGVVTTQPDRSPMFAITPLLSKNQFKIEGCPHEQYRSPVLCSAADRRSRGGGCHFAVDREGRGSRSQPGSTCWIFPRGTGSMRKRSFRPSCIRRGSGCSISAGMCRAPAAVACSVRTTP